MPREAKDGTDYLALSIGYQNEACVYLLRIPLAELEQIRFLRPFPFPLGDSHSLVPGI